MKQKKPTITEIIGNAIIRPKKRTEYKVEDLGATKLTLNHHLIQREDFSLVNERGFTIVFSLFQCAPPAQKPESCVLYLHGNSSSRLEGLSFVKLLVSPQTCLAVMDFSGCGISEGEYISMGFFERQDAESVLDYLKKEKRIERFALWGRSMGASTAIMVAANGMDVCYVVADSPFYSIKHLCQNVA